MISLHSRRKAVRHIIKLFSRRYTELLVRSARLYYVKKARAVEIIIEHKKDLIKTYKATRKTVDAIKKQKNLLLKAEAEIATFVKKDRLRLISFLDGVGAKSLIPYINNHGKMLEEVQAFLKRYNLINLLDLQLKYLENKDYPWFEKVFLIELNLYKQLNQLIDKDFEVLKRFFTQQYNLKMVLDEVKPVFNASLNELNKWEKTRPTVSPLARVFTFMIFTLILVTTVLVPTKNLNNFAKASPAGKKIEQMTKENPTQIGLRNLINQTRKEMGDINNNKDLTNEDKASFIAEYEESIEAMKVLITIAGEVEKAGKSAEKTIAKADELLRESESQMDELEAKLKEIDKMTLE